jgi:hypothetical protein
MNDQKKSKANLLAPSPSLKKPLGLGLLRPSKIKIEDDGIIEQALILN